MNRFLSHLSRALPFITFPLCAFAAWLSTILGLLIWWTATKDARRLRPDDATILYISDTGASYQRLFIAGSSLTAVFWWISLLLGRYLRHIRRIPETVRPRERYAACTAVFYGVGSGVFLILLACFESTNHGVAHWTFTAIFVGFAAISALAEALEVHFLSKTHPDRPHLRRSAIFKMVIWSAALIGVVGFIITYAIGRGLQDDRRWPITLRPIANVFQSIAAVFEWTVAFLFGAYLLTLVMDLWPAYKTRELGWRRRPHPQSDPAAIERRRILKSVGEKNGPNGEAVNDRAQPVMRDLAETPQPSASVVGEA